MRIDSFDWDGRNAPSLAAEIRCLQPQLGEVSDAVAGIIAAVRERGDDAVAEFEARFGTGPAEPRTLPVPVADVRSALERLDQDLRGALETAAANIRSVAEAQLVTERRVQLEQGHSVELRDIPVGSAAVYAPGGAASYPSTVLMGCVPAKTAGVRRVVLATPAGGGRELLDDAILAAAAIGGADEIYSLGGAPGIGGLGMGTGMIDWKSIGMHFSA